MIAKNVAESGEHRIAYPSRVWGWGGVAVATPVFLLIGLSIYGGWPPHEDIVAWGLVLFLTLFSVVGLLLEILAWHLREGLRRPLWWTANRQANLGKALWVSALAGFLMIPDDMRGWDGIVIGAASWALWFVPIFLLNELFDVTGARFKRWRNSTRTQASDSGDNNAR